MKHVVRIREEAEIDISDAANWYEQQQSGLGHEFLDRALFLLKALPEHPLQYPVIYKNIRRALLDKFPFGIFYSVETNHIIVYAVMHASRHPGRWQSRA